jgi:hypothetical protein
MFAFRRARKTAFLRNRDKVAELMNFHKRREIFGQLARFV